MASPHSVQTQQQPVRNEEEINELSNMVKNLLSEQAELKDKLAK